ncbi:NACHT domain-containing protein [Oxynema aestuarii]|uniref:HEAT repeat domain-containing protein n=1 Tax=Oxynema aestuarii AP17 TaxID=2064643 RepID=A0A6H1TZT6_9CYAN|nr:HEAT repeat domain-containing protein [Oxynema aestuarii]QIZ71430.1 hypothetical protein HCG48_13270 [Oxynema aestuarii AP17]
MTNSTPTPADALIAALHEPGRENLLDLVRNPLRLTLLCMTWDGSSLQDIQAELYDRYLRKIYEWNRNLHELEKYAERCGTTTTKLKQDSHQQSDILKKLKQNLNRKLGELAKAALNLPQERFRLSQALVEKHLGEELDKTSLGYLALRLGWLNRVGKDGRGDGIFAFYHATFQEYFAALAVEDWDYFLPREHRDRPVDGKRYRIFEKQWKQVILLWLGRGDIEDEEKEAFIRALVEFKGGVRNFYGYQAYFLAAAGINEFKACSLADEIVRQIVKWGFGYFDIEKQEWQTFLDPIEKAARKAIPETIRQLAIIEFTAIIKNCSDEGIRRQAAASLGEIGQGNPDAIAELLQVIRTTEDEHTRRQVAESLGKIGQGNPDAIAELLQIIRTTEDKDTRRRAAASLGEILTTSQHYAGVVTALKDCLSDEVHQNNFDRFDECYKLIWNCAENLPYPEFYQAWHHPPTTPHPEVEDNTPATPFTQQCNLALLPQILNQAIQTHPVNCQIICIDGSRFSDPSNPALQIYTTLKKAGCRPSPDGKPRTIADLQAYCEDDLSEHQIALIFYEEPTDPPPQGFDIAVLNQLARFSHPPIAVVVPQPLPECRLPQFLESDPDLMATLLQWLQNLDR